MIRITIPDIIISWQDILSRITSIDFIDGMTGLSIFVLGCLISKIIVNYLKNTDSTFFSKNFFQKTSGFICPVLTLLLLLIGKISLQLLGQKYSFTIFLENICLTWIGVVLVIILARRVFFGWFMAVVFIPFVILNIFEIWGYGQSLVRFLDQHIIFSFIGNNIISLYQLLRNILIIIILVRISKWLTTFSETRLSHIKDIKSSTRILIVKILQICLYFMVFVLAMQLLKIPTTTFTVISGAVGIGLGFGLQKVASNFVSGIILLMEKAVKLGDYVELMDGTVGTVKSTMSRYTLIETPQGQEVLVPNEEFITQRIINWTHTNLKYRIEIMFNVDPQADFELVRKLILDVALQHPQCLKHLPPSCNLFNFVRNGAVFQLWFWIEDVSKGYADLKSELMLAVWRKLKEHNIQMAWLEWKQ
jgi:small-conductance mechanosensitive channel